MSEGNQNNQKLINFITNKITTKIKIKRPLKYSHILDRNHSVKKLVKKLSRLLK